MAAESIYKNRVGLTEIRIMNFKGVSKEVTIPIRPITLLYGANSAGKSTIIHALAYLREIICNNNLDADQTEIGGESIRLGGFRNMVHDYDLDKEIMIGVDFSVDDDGISAYLEKYNDEGLEEEELEFEAEEFLNSVYSCGININIGYLKNEKRPFIRTFKITINGEVISKGNFFGTDGIPAINGLDITHSLLKIVYGEEEILNIINNINHEISEKTEKIAKKHATKLRKLLKRNDNKLPFDLELSKKLVDQFSIKDGGFKFDKIKKNDRITSKEILVALTYDVSMDTKKSMLKEGTDEMDYFEFHMACEWMEIHENYVNDINNMLSDTFSNVKLPIIMPHKLKLIDDIYSINIFERQISTLWEVQANDPFAKKKIIEIEDSAKDKYDFTKYDSLNGISEIVKCSFNGTISLCKGEMEKLRYIGPIRIIPSSLNSIEKGEMQSRIGDWATGKAAWELLRRDYNSEKNEIGSLIKNVNEWMNEKSKLDIGYKLDIIHSRMIDSEDGEVICQLAEEGANYVFAAGNRYPETKDEEEDAMNRFREWYGKLPYQNHLRLSQYGKRINLSPKSVGVGITQVLPILTAASYIKMGLITVEQPELHLHPKVQCNLSDVFIESIKKGSKSYILESHSEHLLLRIQRRIREKKLHPSDVSILFIEPSNPERGSDVQRLRLDEEGAFIDDWPDGFFEEGYEEVFAGL